MTSAGRRLSNRPSNAATDAVIWVIIVILTASLAAIAVAGRPMSDIDEPTHYDNALRLIDGSYPVRGDYYSQAMVDEWGCGVGQESVQLPVPCGDPGMTVQALSQQLTTGYIHYPTWFLEAVAFEKVIAVLIPDSPVIDRLRLFGVLLTFLGVGACWLLARSLGFTGPSRVAMTLLPVAAPSILAYGPMVNPQSTQVLCGALITLAGLHWWRTGRGFGWVVLAGAYASLIAVTASLPVAVFLGATLLALIAQRWFGVELSARRVRWWQAGVLAAIILTPIVVYNRVIEAFATVDNQAVYGGLPSPQLGQFLGSLAAEITSPHSPWMTVPLLLDVDPDVIGSTLRGFAEGLPTVITILVFGTLLLRVIGSFGGGGAPTDGSGTPTDGSGDRTSRWPTWLTGDSLLLVATLTVFFLFPPALRGLNAMNFGFDYGIAARYLTSLTPLIVALTLQSIEKRSVAYFLAGIAGLAVIGSTATGW